MNDYEAPGMSKIMYCHGYAIFRQIKKIKENFAT